MQSRPKSYADKRRRDLEFEVGDHVYLKVSPQHLAMRGRKKGKLKPRYLGPYLIKRRIGPLSVLNFVQLIKQIHKNKGKKLNIQTQSVYTCQCTSMRCNTNFIY